MIRCEKQGREKTLDVNDEVRGRRKGERARERERQWVASRDGVRADRVA